jgi:hypothetical protein
LHLEEARQGAAVIGDEELLAGARKGFAHAAALGGAARHGLLDIAGFVGLRDPERVRLVLAGGRGHVDDVDVGAPDHLVGVRGVTRYAVPAREVGGTLFVAPHDDIELAAARLVERGAALDLTHVPATDDAPANRHDGLHNTASSGRARGRFF